jgi:hypothetical protein
LFFDQIICINFFFEEFTEIGEKSITLKASSKKYCESSFSFKGVGVSPLIYRFSIFEYPPNLLQLLSWSPRQKRSLLPTTIHRFWSSYRTTFSRRYIYNFVSEDQWQRKTQVPSRKKPIKFKIGPLSSSV